MKQNLLIASTVLAFVCSAALGAPEKLSPADQAAAFKTAGFKLKGKRWQACDDRSPSYTPGVIEDVRDLNGDGLPEAVISEGSSNCYGNTGAAYSLVSKQADGSWKLITNGTGMLNVLNTRGAGNWPDLEVGGPGFCFPVERWNGRAYALHRHQYDGKSCRPK